MCAKVLVITNIQEGIDHYLSEIGYGMETVRIIHSYGADICHPYGCSMRNIIISIYQENIDGIYIIFHTNSNENFFTAADFKIKFAEADISEETIKTIEYLKVAGNDVYSWLLGAPDAAEKIKKNINMIQQHPLIPKNFQVYGFLVNEKGQLERRIHGECT